MTASNIITAATENLFLFNSWNKIWFLRRLKQRKAFKSNVGNVKTNWGRVCRESICHNRVVLAAEAYLTWASDKWKAPRRWEDPIDHCLKMIVFRLEVILSNESPSQLQQWVENLLKCKGDIMIGLVERQWRLQHHLRWVTVHVKINEAWHE